jgi:hypothetical protein
LIQSSDSSLCAAQHRMQPTGLSPAEIAASFVAVRDFERIVTIVEPPGG